ncbi:MAG: hypothetical protein RI893_1217 [Pseudomonadota bacterium]|jgi:Tfp pilus assembly protein PilN
MQQINLYSDILKARQKRAIVNLYLAVLVTVVLLCVGFSAYLLWSISTAETELHNAQRIFKNEQEQVAKNITLSPNTPLLSEIKHWQNSVDEAAQTLQLLADRQPIFLQRFSSYLQALSQQSDPEVWITAIHIAGKKRALSIQGSTFKPEKIALVLQQLQQDATFKGQFFDKLVIQPFSESPEQMNFTISSSEPILTVKNHAQ